MRWAGVLVAVALMTASAAQAATPFTPFARASIVPAHPLFGDSFAYAVDVAVPEGKSGAVRIEADVEPFTRVEPTRVSRSVENGVARITVTETIACLVARCLPTSAGTPVALRRARITIDDIVSEAPPVGVRIGTRVGDAAVKATEPVFRTPAALPVPTVRVDPVLAQAALLLIGLGLVFAGLFVLTASLRRRRRAAIRASAIDPIERAVRLLRESETRDSTDRRRAASLAARVVGRGDVALLAERVAWSRAAPAPPEAATLANKVEQTAEPYARRDT